MVVTETTGSLARPLTVEVTGRKPVRDATTETVDVADGDKPLTVSCAAERVTVAPFDAEIAYV